MSEGHRALADMFPGGKNVRLFMISLLFILSTLFSFGGEQYPVSLVLLDLIWLLSIIASQNQHYRRNKKNM